MSRFVALMDQDEAALSESDVDAAAQEGPAFELGAEDAAASLSLADATVVATTPRLIDPLFFVDLEMTGLDASKDNILEVAMIATDRDLETLIEGPSLVIPHGDDVLASMNEWSLAQHASSGLTERCRRSSTSLKEVEEALIAFLREHSPSDRPRSAILAGACVYKDKEFLDAHMPRLQPLLSHRVVDVSSVRELAKRWHPMAQRACPRNDTALHRALDDIRYSIEELRYYRTAVFQPAEKKRRDPNEPRVGHGVGGRAGKGSGGGRGRCSGSASSKGRGGGREQTRDVHMPRLAVQRATPADESPD
jgi:oligoribonuclease